MQIRGKKDSERGDTDGTAMVQMKRRKQKNKRETTNAKEAQNPARTQRCRELHNLTRLATNAILCAFLPGHSMTVLP